MKISIPTELQRALTTARAAVEGRQKIEAAISQALRIQPAAEADLQAALALLGDIEAGSILSGIPAQASTGEAQKRLTAARDHVSALEARIAALRRRLIESEDGILSAHAAIGPVRAEFTAKCTAEFELEYKKSGVRVSRGTPGRIESVRQPGSHLLRARGDGNPRSVRSRQSDAHRNFQPGFERSRFRCRRQGTGPGNRADRRWNRESTRGAGS